MNIQPLSILLAGLPAEHKVNLFGSYREAFGQLSDKEVKALIQISEWRSYGENDIIFSEDNPANYFFLLLKGTVQMTFTHKINLRVSPGMIFGDWAFLNKTTRLATAKALSRVEVAAISNTEILNLDIVDPNVALKVVLNLASGLVKRLLSSSQVSTESLLQEGESAHLEFKSTLRKNLYTQKNDPSVERAVLKTIAAFLNSAGGVLLIGVDDKGNVSGLKHDDFTNHDKLLLHLNHLILDKLGQGAFRDVCYNISRLQDKEILRIDCTPAPHPVFLKDKETESFFIRNGPETIALTISEALNYIQKRF
jgi:CRP-like cAMP-binding protein